MKVIRPKTFDIQDFNMKRWHEDLFELTNRGISFGSGIDTEDQNIDGRMIDVPNTGTAGVQFTVNHNLGRVPLFFDVKFKNLAGDIFASATATKTQAFFTATTNNMHVRLFIH